MSRMIFLELNEVNFDFVERYIKIGHLPNFKKFLDNHGYQKTTSEEVYENIEPWIQWTSIHTGLSFERHRIFRLGDMAGSGLRQIWEDLEANGLKVGAVSPMNAINQTKNPAFFFPDPWTFTPASGSFILKKVYQSISQCVRYNADARITNKSKMFLFLGLLFYGKVSSLDRYFKFLVKSKRNHSFSAIFLDRFLADIYVRLWKRCKPDFSTLFLNGAAHIQHHYMFNSKVYSGKKKNPDWYINHNLDPLFDVYELYDEILGELLKIEKNICIMIATGLSQEPHEAEIYYYRLKNHAEFIRHLGIRFKEIQIRMSRDFLITFESTSLCDKAAQVIERIADINGKPVFEADNRGLSLFVTLSYPYEIKPNFNVYLDGKKIEFGNQVLFIAIKNAHHNGIGYFFNSLVESSKVLEPMPVWAIKGKILEFFNIT